ncbi:MAG: tetratricopeptide repeat protein [Acidobacteriales bacterium]|nr:tetratricopeptide repeat protein [Terriglobales bacterium]
MARNLIVTLAALLMAAGASAQERRPRIDVESYLIRAEISPRTQSLTATAEVRFTPLEDNVTAPVFELNNALTVSKVVDGRGRDVQFSRNTQDFTVRVNLPESLAKNAPAKLTFTYEGRFTGREESPVYGIKFANIQNDYTYLLYSARWFPINGYTTDRYKAEYAITAPSEYKVIGSGIETTSAGEGGKTTHTFRFSEASFAGSIALVQGEPARVSSQGATSLLYFRGANRPMATPYGDETGKVMAFLTSVYGLPPQRDLTIVETDGDAPNGYSAPGILFLSSKSIGTRPNVRLISNQVARQWWGALVSPETRNHIWISNGLARYSEILYIEHTAGAAALETEIRDTYIEALTVENPPMIQAGRMEDYSPEFWALTASKGAAVVNMLRYVVGEDKFPRVLRTLAEQYAWKSVATSDFQKVAEAVAGQDLRSFFIQWIESSGAPEFKLEYTVFRTQKGFRAMGKISQDLDTFRMPVELKIETEGNPEDKKVEVVGTSSEFSVETFGKPKKVILDPNNRVLRFSNRIRVAVAIRRGEQFTEIGEFGDALKEYQKALEVNRSSSMAHYRIAEVFFLQSNYQSAANEFREALNGDLDPKWIEVWSHISLGKIFDVTGQRERAVNSYQQAVRTKDNTQGAQEEAAKYLKKPYERPKPNY